MSRVHLALLGVLLIPVGLGMAAAQNLLLPLVTHGVYWAVPSGPPEAVTGVQIVEPQVGSQDHAGEVQLLRERLKAAAQDHRVTFGPGGPGLRVIVDAGDRYELRSSR